MLTRFALLVAAVLFAAVASAEGPYRPIFNGEDLSGWKVVPQSAADREDPIFAVTDGALHAYPGHEAGSKQPFVALVTEEEFKDYQLRLEFKWGEKKFRPRADAVRDAGVLFHVFEDSKVWPRSVECQVQEGDTGDIWAIHSRVTAKGHHHYNPRSSKRPTFGGHDQGSVRFSRSYSWEKPGWNQIELTIRGDHARFEVNGHVVNEAIDMRRWDEAKQEYVPLTRGKICLQAEGAEVFYRNVMVRKLED